MCKELNFGIFILMYLKQIYNSIESKLKNKIEIEIEIQVDVVLATLVEPILENGEVYMEEYT